MSVLNKIAANRRKEIERLKIDQPLEGFIDNLENLPPSKFKAALEVTERVNIIAEIKKGSPSKGILRPDLDPGILAREYAKGGAAALSVLTETKHFYGSYDNLKQAHAAVSLPVLCKDFVVDRYQLFHARSLLADAVLLIVALHSPDELTRHLRLAHKIGIDCLVEVHDEVELDIALGAGAVIIGVNNRNLKDFTISLETSERLAAKMPNNIIRVAESGIDSSSDITRLQQAGYNCFLIGETLVMANDPVKKLWELTSV
ncbi:MAG: indole-3-glycerol phosphate synthase TrpC [candidate division Zixibacteria bacterium]|nr:indole-3-glycerol phosphate synthase TrpC [candidate division Zixibacteria bacterium]